MNVNLPPGKDANRKLIPRHQLCSKLSSRCKLKPTRGGRKSVDFFFTVDLKFLDKVHYISKYLYFKVFSNIKKKH